MTVDPKVVEFRSLRFNAVADLLAVGPKRKGIGTGDFHDAGRRLSAAHFVAKIDRPRRRRFQRVAGIFPNPVAARRVLRDCRRYE